MKERVTKDQQKAREVFMKAVFKNAPNGAKALYESVLASAPEAAVKNRPLTSEERRHIIINTNLELAILNRTINKINQEITHI